MNFYTGLFDSMVSCCGRIGMRHGPVYTIAMLALGVGVSFNILSITDLLWTLGVVNDPYRSGPSLHPQHYLWGLLYLAFVVNTVLARLKFSADHRGICAPRIGTSAAAAPAYILGSAGVFLMTLGVELRTLG